MVECGFSADSGLTGSLECRKRGGKPDPEHTPAAPRTPSCLPVPLRAFHAVSLNSQGSHLAFGQSWFRRRWGKSSHALALSLHFCGPESGTTAGGGLGNPMTTAAQGQEGNTQESGSRNWSSGCARGPPSSQPVSRGRALAPVLVGSLESDRCKGQAGIARSHREQTPHFSSGSDLPTPGSFGRERESPASSWGGRGSTRGEQRDPSAPLPGPASPRTNGFNAWLGSRRVFPAQG